MDILDALATSKPARSGAAGQRCKIGRWLDSLSGEPGHDALVTAFETRVVEKGRIPEGGRSLPQLCAIAARLGQPTSDKTVSEHRNHVCRCTW